MDEEVRIVVNSDVYEKFCLSLNLSNDDEKTAIETCMRWYIANTFEKASQEYNPKTIARCATEASRDYFAKAVQRIPVWALKRDQYNHKIIKAFFVAMDIDGKATITLMERLCSDKDHADLYIPTFRSNYAQMKLDGPKSHGKVFEDNGEDVWIWSEVESTLMQYKSNFYNEEV